MSKVADPLREYLEGAHGTVRIDADYARGIADQIDREHERRMKQQAYELRRAFCRYLGGVLNDYRHGMKRKRLRK